MRPASPVLRCVAVLAWLAFVVFLAAAGWVHWYRSDLDPLRHTLSRYLVGPGSGWLVTAYVLQGLALVALGAAVGRVLRREGESWQTASAGRLLVLGGFSLAAVGLCDLFWPPADPVRPGWHHYLLAGLAFLGVGAGALGQTLRAGRQPDWRRWHRRSVAVLGAAVVFAIVHRAGLGLPRGLGQKLIIASLLAWVPLMGSALWHRPASSGDNAPPPEHGPDLQ